MRIAVAALLVVAGTLPALAQRSLEIQQPRGTWQQPGPIQQPKGTWQVPGEIQQPKGTWQVPGEIQQPKGTWQVPGEIQVPKGIQAVRATAAGCERRLSVVGDALFDFDKSSARRRRPGDRQARRQALAHRRPHRRHRLGRLQHEALGGARHHGARLAGRPRDRAGHDADQGLWQDQPDRPQPDQRRPRRSGRPAEEPPRRGGVRHLHLSGCRAPEPRRRSAVSPA